MAKKQNASVSKDINISDINAAANDSITMVPTDVKFDASGRVLVTNDKVNEFIKESLVQEGAVTLTPGNNGSSEIADINVFCHFHINLKRGCSANDK